MSALPSNPNLAHLKKQAKDLHKAFQASAAEVCALLQQHLPRFAQSSPDEILAAEFSLHDAQHVVAREYGFDHWSALRQTVENSAQSQQDDATSRAPTRDQLDERLQRHIDTLGFHSVGSYRIWCHKQGLDKGLDKSDAQLQQERALFKRLKKTQRPPFKKDYRPSQVRFLTQAYEGNAPDLWEGWTRHFAGIEDAGEREALYRIMVQCEKYAKIGGASQSLARHYRDWLKPVEDWFPQSDNASQQLADLIRFLLGRDELPPSAAPVYWQDEKPSVHYARIREKRQTVLSSDDIAAYEALGYVRIKEAFSPTAALEMQDFMWSELERMHGIRRDDLTTWPEEERYPQTWTTLHLNATKAHDIYQAIAAPRLMDAYEELAGEQARRYKQSWGSFVVTFPEKSGRPWDLGVRWPLYADPARPWMHNVGLFFSSVGAGAGGKLVVERSHHLVQAYFAQLKPSERIDKRHRYNFFNAHPYFAELTGRTAGKGDRVRRHPLRGARGTVRCEI